MGIHKRPDWANITFEELMSLNHNQLKQYQCWLDAQEVKADIKRANFQEYLEASIENYSENY